MAKEITDEMLAEFAVTGAPDEVPDMLKAKYDRFDRVMFYHTDRPGQNEARWRKIIAAFQAQERTHSLFVGEPSARGGNMSTEQNKAIVRRAVSAMGRGEVTLHRRLLAGRS